MKNVDLVILAGGKGSRIKQYLKDKPKPMMRFNKIHFLRYLINMYSKYPINNIYIFIILYFLDNISSALINPSGSNNLSFILRAFAAPSSPIGNSIN